MQSTRRTLQFELKFKAPSVNMSNFRLFLIYAFRDESANKYKIHIINAGLHDK